MAYKVNFHGVRDKIKSIKINCINHINFVSLIDSPAVQMAYSYVLPQDLNVDLIMNGLTSNFAGFVKNYNMHNMGKTIGELHALLIEYEKGLPKKAATPQGEGKGKGKDKSVIPKPKNPKNMAKDDACHHCKEVGHCKRNCPSYLAELIKKKKQVGTANSSGKIIRKPFPYRAERATDLLGQIHIDVCGEYISQKFKDYLKACGIFQQLTPPYTPQHNGVSERINRTLLDMVRSMMNLITLSLSFWDYALETAIRILNMVPTKKVDKTPYELCSWRNLISQEVSGRAVELEEIQDVDTSPSENTSKIPIEVKGFEPPQEEVVPVRRMDTSKRGYIPMQERLDLNKTQGASTPEEVTSSFEWEALLDWKSSKQSTTAMSATEAEYIATSEAAMEAVWIRKFISGLGIIPTINEPIKMFCDNSAALLIVNEPGSSVWTTDTTIEDTLRSRMLRIGEIYVNVVVKYYIIDI
ncbi:retrotransposon protein, putative, ty1-copia subclass [Tanacetum coccineum]|uniref:Retrotransposon protein, putative, ty1-copia subclass n=1 Tax=Tanacetum coccineum TaxID=301880 RepID=A0ABQ4ZYT8_9ASTR